MSRFLSIFNALGVAILAVLLGIQWRINSQVNQRADTLEKVRQQQAGKLDEDDRTIKGDVADLDEFRSRLKLAELQLKDLENKLNQMTVERNQLQADRDCLKLALSKWIAAISDRDTAIKKASAEIRKLASERDEQLSKFNDLAQKYNAFVKSQQQ